MTGPAPIVCADGFHPEESDGFYKFRWMDVRGLLTFEAVSADRFLEFQVLSEFRDLSQELTCSVSDGAGALFPLRSGWSPVSIAIPTGVDRVALSVNKPFPKAYYPRDHRTLAVRVQQPELHADLGRHRETIARQRNGLTNGFEIARGTANVQSTPTRLGLDISGVCNVKPPCVYCDWDNAKALEGDAVDTPFTVDTLRSLGPFFDNSLNLINCSIGEPFMMRNLPDLVEEFATHGKEFDVTTNGQILPDRLIERLVGRKVNILISLDAGTPETYAKLRNNRFDAIIRNLERLIAAKGGPGHYPHVELVFMPMRINLDELPGFVELAARLKVDRIVLRPLNYSTVSTLNWDREGYRFEYLKELLPFDELVRASGRAAALCERAGVRLFDQMDFGGSMSDQFHQLFEEGRQSAGAAPAPESPTNTANTDAEVGQPMPLPSLGGESQPICLEPWESLYILRRGVFPCCHAPRPIAKMDGFQDAWNSPLLQEIRADLAAGRLHQYCLESESCPIVRKVKAADPSMATTCPPQVDEPPPVQLHLLGKLKSRAASLWQRVAGS